MVVTFGALRSPKSREKRNLIVGEIEKSQVVLSYSVRVATLNLSRRAWYLDGRGIDRRSASHSWAARASRPAGRPALCDKVTRVKLCKSQVQFFTSTGFIGLGCLRCARSVESVRRAARLSVARILRTVATLAHRVNDVRSALCSSTANSSERITEPSRTSSASRTAAAVPKNNTAATMCPM